MKRVQIVNIFNFQNKILNRHKIISRKTHTCKYILGKRLSLFLTSCTSRHLPPCNEQLITSILIVSPVDDIQRTHIQLHTTNLQIQTRTFRPTDLMCQYSTLLADQSRLKPDFPRSLVVHLTCTTVCPRRRPVNYGNW